MAVTTALVFPAAAWVTVAGSPNRTPGIPTIVGREILLPKRPSTGTNSSGRYNELRLFSDQSPSVPWATAQSTTAAMSLQVHMTSDGTTLP